MAVAPVSILICSDGPVYREAGALFFGAQEGIGEVRSCSEERCAVTTAGQQPSIVLYVISEFSTFDGTMAGIAGTSSSSAVLAVAPQIPGAFARELLRAGASGCVSGISGFDAVLQGIYAVAGGEEFICSQTALQLAKPEVREALTERERDVLRMVALGYSNREAAEELFLSVRTIESHRASLGEKVGGSDRRNLVSFALSQRLIP